MKRKRSNRKSQKDNFKDKDRLTDTGAESRADRRAEQKADMRERRDCLKSKANDWTWYAHTPQLVKDYASFPFGDPLGSLLPSDTLFYTAQDTQAAIPGVCAIKFAPTVGATNDETSAVNIAMRNIYSYVRHANSGHSNYEGPDLMIYLLAMDSVYMYLAFLKRCYGVMLDYTPLNRYYPKALVQGMGVDFADIQANLNDFRGFINQFAVRVGSMCVPNSMSYMARHMWMCEGLYTDSKAAKAQTYFYTPEYFLQLTSPTASDPTNFLTYKQLPANAKFADLVSFGESLLDPIIINEDMNIMSGDILKAFGADGVVKTEGIMDGYMVLPVYDEEVLTQMENSRILGGSISGTISQNTAIGTGYITSDITLTASPISVVGGSAIPSGTVSDVAALLTQAFNGRKILNYHIDGVTPELVMVSTRGLFTASGWTNSGANFTTKTFECGSEIYTGAVYEWYQRFVTTGQVQLNTIRVGTVALQILSSGANLQQLGGMLWTANMWSNFDWAPHIILADAINIQTGSSTTITDVVNSGVCADYDNYTYIDSVNINNLNKVALLSEFSVPQMGSYSLGF